MRTCQLFRSICTPLLYTHIASDDFPSLLWAANRHPGLFAPTKHLYIEYKEKISIFTYRGLLNRGVWTRVGLTAKEEVEKLTWECEEEAFDLSSALMADFVEGKKVKSWYLDTIAICSIYPEESSYWARGARLVVAAADVRGNMSSREDDFKDDDITTCRTLWSFFIADVKHLCLRNNHGPLSVSSGCGGKPVVTCHFDSSPKLPPNPIPLCAYLGNQARWILEPSSHSSWNDAFVLILDYLRKLHRHIWLSDDDNDADALKLRTYGSSAEIGLVQTFNDDHSNFLRDAVSKTATGTKTMLTVAEQRPVAASMSPNLESWLRKRRGSKDRIDWHTSADTPICESCGSGPPTC